MMDYLCWSCVAIFKLFQVRNWVAANGSFWRDENKPCYLRWEKKNCPLSLQSQWVFFLGGIFLNSAACGSKRLGHNYNCSLEKLQFFEEKWGHMYWCISLLSDGVSKSRLKWEKIIIRGCKKVVSMLIKSPCRCWWTTLKGVGSLNDDTPVALKRDNSHPPI